MAETQGAAAVKVVDIAGKTLAVYPSSGSGNININFDYPDGIYFIVLENNGCREVRKVVKISQ
jgi:hypothetical protein